MPFGRHLSGNLLLLLVRFAGDVRHTRFALAGMAADRAHGDTMALDILRMIRALTACEVVAVDFMRTGTRWVYRVEVITPSGQRKTLDVDASAGVLLPRKGGE